MNLMQNTLLQGGKYRIEKVLGQGGFGITYLAVQVGLNRKVAIKEFFMKEYCNRDAETSHVSIPSDGSKELVARFRQKFVKEAQTIAGLNHPHIIRIYDVFEENGTAYYVMEYHDNGSLSELVKQHGALPEAEALRYIREVAKALTYIHKRNMNHLDIKPGNILLDEEGCSVLIDFGLSKRYDESGQQTSTTPVGISHGYAPMEQYKQGGVGTFSPATDIYSLGATLYKLLTGKTPPDASDVNDDGLPELPSSVSASTCTAIVAAMQPRRKDRPQSVAAFFALLDKEPIVVDDDEDTILDVELKPTPAPQSVSFPLIATFFIYILLIGSAISFIICLDGFFRNIDLLDDPVRSGIYVYGKGFIPGCLISLTVLIGNILIKRRKCSGFWFMSIMSLILVIPTILKDYEEVLYFSIPIGCSLLIFYIILHIKQNGNTAWDMMEKSPSLKKIAIYFWALYLVLVLLTPLILSMSFGFKSNHFDNGITIFSARWGDSKSYYSNKLANKLSSESDGIGEVYEYEIKKWHERATMYSKYWYEYDYYFEYADYLISIGEHKNAYRVLKDANGKYHNNETAEKLNQFVSKYGSF